MPSTRNAKGYQDANGQVQIAVRVSKQMFDEMKSFAIKSNRSIAAQIRDYIEVGIEVDRDIEEDAA